MIKEKDTVFIVMKNVIHEEKYVMGAFTNEEEAKALENQLDLVALEGEEIYITVWNGSKEIY